MNNIQDFLASLGFKVDKNSFKEFTDYVGKAGKSVDGLGGSFGKLTLGLGGLSLGLTAFAGGLAAFSAGISSAGKGMGNVTMGVDKFALSLYTTTKNARNLQSVMNAMGIDSLEDLKYINLLPEQRKQFMELRGLANQLAPSAETQKGLAEIRKMGFEFQKMQIEMSYIGLKLLGDIGNLLRSPLFVKIPKFIDLGIALLAYVAAHIGKHPLRAGAGGLLGGIGGGLGGAQLGGLAGGAVGSVFGPAGTVIGAGLGSSVGASLGAATGAAAGTAAGPFVPRLFTGLGKASKSAWENGLHMILGYEGGYKGYTPSTGDPETNFGITAPTYNAWKKKHVGMPALKNINRDIASSIYKSNYWDPFNTYKLSEPLHIAAFNAAVNMGVGTSGKLLKQSHGDLHSFFQAQRQYYHRIVEKHPAQGVYLKGWTNRTNNLESKLNKMYPTQVHIKIDIHGNKSPVEAAHAVAQRLDNYFNTRNLQGFA
jgi:hypothetical protein